VTLRAQNSSPGPIALQLEQNGAPLARFAFSREDESWQEYQHSLELRAGIHVLGIRFFDTAEATPIDRDAVIDWLRIEASP
jgi:hypothetical protein